MSRPDANLPIPWPRMAPFGIEVTKSAVQDVWDTFVKPMQAKGVQSIEDRTLMAILRAVHEGMDQAGDARAARTE